MNATKKLIIILCLFSGTIWAAAQKTIICCIGNSITAAGYPTNLLKLLGTTSYTVYNEGVGGTTLLKNGDMPYWTKGKFQHVFSVKPDIVTIKLGTNDTKSQNWDPHHDEFERDYKAMIDTVEMLSSKPKIWIVLPIPVIKESFGIRDSVLKLIIPILIKIGQERNLPIIDANTPLLHAPQCYQTDGVHPNAAGTDSIAHIIYRALMSATPVRNLIHPKNLDKRPQSEMYNDNLLLSIPAGSALTLSFFDLRGCHMHAQTIQTPGRHAFYPKSLPQGAYLLRIQSDGRQIFRRTIAIP